MKRSQIKFAGDHRSSGRFDGHEARQQPMAPRSAAEDGAEHPVAAMERFRKVRNFSTQLCAHLEPEDCVIQSMTEASPIRWHLAHTTWFFETFILKQLADYQPLDDHYAYLFNSYYNALGQQYPRDRRGVLSRPTLREVWKYREYVDEHLIEGLASGQLADDSLLDLIELGLNHEQQHQELMLTDIKHAFSCNPLLPAYTGVTRERRSLEQPTLAKQLEYHALHEGLAEVGQPESAGFSYDNEGPRHTVFIGSFELANRTSTCGEYLEFMEDGGYARPELWLSEGWNCVTTLGWQAPLYWQKRDGEWFEFTLAGLEPLDLARPVSHLSLFEADAFARWSECRLPTEFEWEYAATSQPEERSADRRWSPFADELIGQGLTVHPQVVERTIDEFGDMLGNVWEWTSSSYAPYPGYRPMPGAVGEYNGKFMCNQYVLRGGSCATSRDHIRPTYRNFFPAHARWQFSGVRLAKDVT